jgi:SNF family Na+-dependent transporter
MYGGGAFIFAYAICLVVVGFPLLCAEINLGKRYLAPFSYCLGMLNKYGSVTGWAACVNSAFIALYYSAVMAFCALSAINIFGNIFVSGVDASSFFSELLQSSVSDGCTFPLILLLAGCWAVICLLLRGGAKRISYSAKFSVALSFFLFTLVALRGLLYRNSGAALTALFLPNFAMLKSFKLWTEALAQVLLSLSLAAGVMPTFAINIGTRSVKKCAAEIISANFLWCVIASVALFTSLYGCGLFDKVTANGILTTFFVYPQALSQMFVNPVISDIFGGVFYISLFFTALQSATSLLSPLLKSLSAKVNKPCAREAPNLCLWLFFLSLPFAFGVRIMLMNGCDFLSCLIFAPAIAAAESVILFGKPNKFAVQKTNKKCAAKVGRIVKFICPALLCFLCAGSIMQIVFSGLNADIKGIYLAAAMWCGVALFAALPLRYTVSLSGNSTK